MRTSVVIDNELAAQARELGINMSAAAREGLRRAARRRRAELDRDAYRARPEAEDGAWDDAEAWVGHVKKRESFHSTSVLY